VFDKLCHSKCGSSLQVTDTRIGTGIADIAIGTTVFNADENIVATFDVKNIAALTENGINYYWLREDLVVRDSNGAIVLVKPAIIDGKEPLFSKPLKFKNSFTMSGVSGIKPGKYNVVIFVTDIVSLKTAKTEIPITIK
jgi:hypothetical protein